MTPEIDKLITEKNTISSRLEEAILTSDLSRREKLSLITEYDLWPIDTFIQHPFGKQEQELQERVKLATGKEYCVVDDIFHGVNSSYERYQDVYYSDVIDSYEDEDEDEDDNTITLVTNRTNDMTVEVTFDEFKELLLDYAFKTRRVGFNLHW